MSSDDILYNNNNKESFATTLFIEVWHEVIVQERSYHHLLKLW